jgi:hypothetical protein
VVSSPIIFGVGVSLVAAFARWRYPALARPLSEAGLGVGVWLVIASFLSLSGLRIGLIGGNVFLAGVIGSHLWASRGSNQPAATALPSPPTDSPEVKAAKTALAIFAIKEIEPLTAEATRLIGIAALIVGNFEPTHPLTQLARDGVQAGLPRQIVHREFGGLDALERAPLAEIEEAFLRVVQDYGIGANKIAEVIAAFGENPGLMAWRDFGPDTHAWIEKHNRLRENLRDFGQSVHYPRLRGAGLQNAVIQQVRQDQLDLFSRRRPQASA